MVIETLIDRVRGGSYITLEITPAHEPTITPLLDKIKTLELPKLVDGFSVTDNPLAKLRYSSLFAALRAQEYLDRPVIATLSMRDRNKIALQSDLLGASDCGVRAILALTGDPASMSDQPNAKGVFEGDSTMLLEMIRCLNSGHDHAGKPFKIAPPRIYPFTVSNSYARNLTNIAKKFAKKIANYSVATITQPVFDLALAKELIGHFDAARARYSDERCESQLVLGFFPITRLRTAQFLSSHVPGVYVPQSWIDALMSASKLGEEEEYKVGMDLSLRLLRDLKSLHPKIHMMTANRFDVAKALLEEA
ncbi:MAG: methylenetetrahydrofolate reductase [Campylobacterales bacterium]